jgi:hypothetical protein
MSTRDATPKELANLGLVLSGDTLEGKDVHLHTMYTLKGGYMILVLLGNKTSLRVQAKRMRVEKLRLENFVV